MDIDNEVMEQLYQNGSEPNLDYLGSIFDLLNLHGVEPKDITTLTKVRGFVRSHVGYEYGPERFRTIDELCRDVDPPQKYLINTQCLRPFEYEQDLQEELAKHGLPSELRKNGEENAWELLFGPICVRSYGLFKCCDAPQRPPKAEESDDDVPF